MKHATARDSGPDAALASPAGAAQELIAPAPRVAAAANVAGMDAYRALVDEAERDNAGFWRAWRARRWFGASRSPRCWTIPMRPLPLVRRRPAHASFTAWTGTSPAGWASAPPLFEADDGAVTPISYRALLARASANWPTP